MAKQCLEKAEKTEKEIYESNKREQALIDNIVKAIRAEARGSKDDKPDSKIKAEIEKSQTDLELISGLLDNFDEIAKDYYSLYDEYSYTRALYERKTEELGKLGFFSKKRKIELEKELTVIEDKKKRLDSAMAKHKISHFVRPGKPQNEVFTILRQKKKKIISSIQENEPLLKQKKDVSEMTADEAIASLKSSRKIRDEVRRRFEATKETNTLPENQTASLVLAEKGKEVIFGRFFQESGNTASPLKWIVLDVSGNNILLISKYVIKKYKYGLKDHFKNPSGNWYRSWVLCWLNEYFYKDAFSDSEKENIRSYMEIPSLRHSEHPAYKVTLLPEEDLKLLPLPAYNNENYLCEATPFAGNGESVLSSWWIYSDNSGDSSVKYAGKYGVVPSLRPEYDYGVRPVIWVNLAFSKTKSDYNKAMEMIKKGNEKDAYFLLRNMDYKDSAEETLKIYDRNPKFEFWEKDVGDTCLFGKCPENAHSGKMTLISWKILAKENGKILIISNEAVAKKTFNSGNENTVWEYSTICEWLNNEFINGAFSETEKKMILNTTHSDVNSTDKVFFLSNEEVDIYLKSEDERKCIANRLFASSKKDFYCEWYLRTMNKKNSVAYIDLHGRIKEIDSASEFPYGIRPAMWIDPDA